MDSTMYNSYLRQAREHGQHDYQKGRDCNPEQYVKPELRESYRDGYQNEHELESQLA